MKYKVVRPNFIAYTIATTPGRAASNLNYRFKAEHGRWPEDLITPDELICLGSVPPTDLVEQVIKELTDGQMVMDFDGLIFKGYSSKGVSRVKEVMI